jgi:hypothetical protein
MQHTRTTAPQGVRGQTGAPGGRPVKHEIPSGRAVAAYAARYALRRTPETDAPLLGGA